MASWLTTTYAQFKTISLAQTASQYVVLYAYEAQEFNIRWLHTLPKDGSLGTCFAIWPPVALSQLLIDFPNAKRVEMMEGTD